MVKLNFFSVDKSEATCDRGCMIKSKYCLQLGAWRIANRLKLRDVQRKLKRANGSPYSIPRLSRFCAGDELPPIVAGYLWERHTEIPVKVLLDDHVRVAKGVK